MTALAMRSFIDPVGFADSSFARIRADPAGTMRRSSTIGVCPMASRTPLDRRTSACTVECLRDISQNVLRRFTSHAETNETVADGVAAPPRPALRHRVHAAEARGLAYDRQGPQERLGSRARAHIEAHDCAEGAHLTARRIVARMRGKARVVHGGQIGSPREAVGKTH